MQVKPLGQKKPLQQDAQFAVLAGISFEFFMLTIALSTLQAHPGSHPGTQEVKLQFVLGFTN